METRHPRLLPTCVLLFSLFLSPLRALGSPLPATERHLLLAVELNGHDTGLMVEASDHAGHIAIQADDVKVLGLVGTQPVTSMPNAPAAPADGTRMIALDDLPNVTYKIDERKQILVLHAADSALIPTTIGTAAARANQSPATRPDWGGLMNYNLLGTGGTAQGSDAMNGVIDGRIFSPYGTLASGFLGQTETNTGNIARLDTNWTFYNESGMARWEVGDFITGGTGWSRPFRMGGVQLASDFSMRPDLVTSPLPQFSGRAAVPSTVDVLIDGVRQLSQNVQPGPFAINQAPIVSGAGDVSVVVRDALGQQTVQNFSFYASPQLLRPGLASYSVETGYTRNGYGTLSDDYRQPAAVGTLRYGVNDWLTVESHMEASDHVSMAGGGVAINVMGLGVLSGAVAASDSFGHSSDWDIPIRPGAGGQYTVGFEHVGRWYSLSASRTATVGNFADVPAGVGDPVPKSINRAGAGISFGRWGNAHIAYIDVQQGMLMSHVDDPTYTAGNSKILSATYNRPLTDSTQIYATAYRDFATSHSTGLTFGLTMALGQRSSASFSGSASDGRPGGSADVAQAATVPGEVGWHVGDQENQQSQQIADVTYIAQPATMTAAVEHIHAGSSDETIGRAGVQGALVFSHDTVFAANRVDDSFAVVSTDGIPNVPVLQENRPVGKTDSDGLLLVPGLRGWEGNRLAVDPAQLPPDLDLGEPHMMVRPEGHAGVTADFKLKRRNQALIILVDANGKPLPPGAIATLKRTHVPAPVGFDGQAFISDMKGQETLEVETVTERCQAHFTYKPTQGELPQIGPVKCLPEIGK